MVEIELPSKRRGLRKNTGVARLHCKIMAILNSGGFNIMIVFNLVCCLTGCSVNSGRRGAVSLVLSVPGV